MFSKKITSASTRTISAYSGITSARSTSNIPRAAWILHQILVITPNSAEAFLGVLPDAHRTQILCLLLLSALRLTMADIVLINPRFEISYWGLEHALPLIGKRANMPVACLPLLAALTPAGHRRHAHRRERRGRSTSTRCARADIVGVTGMVRPAAADAGDPGELKRRGAFTVVGGPWVTRQAKTTSPASPTSSSSARPRRPGPDSSASGSRDGTRSRYEQAEKTDMTTVPTPRFDLLKMRHYAFGSVQFSRGCPFQCEFCDIIVTFGRQPRIKTSPQIIAELEASTGPGACGSSSSSMTT